MGQDFDEKGNVVPYTAVEITPATVLQIKAKDSDGYEAVKLAVGIGKGKYNKKPILGELKKAGKDEAPEKIVEVPGQLEDKETGDEITAADVLEKKDTVTVTGWSKGRGFAGVMKRWGFHGGPQTHGQSDRLRAPGSIGQTTDPGRVHKGKKMPGHYGTDQVTVENLRVVKIDEENNQVWISGAIPGPTGGYVIIKKAE